MQHLPPELVQHVLTYAFPPVCRQPPLPVCRHWVQQQQQTCCRRAAPMGCPAAPWLCAAHQQPELTLWSQLWQAVTTQRTECLGLGNVHTPTLQHLQEHMADHLPFEIIGIIMSPPPQETWIRIAPGSAAAAWWEAYREWRGLPPDFCD